MAQPADAPLTPELAKDVCERNGRADSALGLTAPSRERAVENP